jgi:predicted nucleic acid-binding protein
MTSCAPRFDHRGVNGANRSQVEPFRAASWRADVGRRAAFVEALIAAFPTLSFDLLVARVYARIWAGSASSGTEVGAHDRLVAATAISAGWRVGTANIRHFNRIPGLDVTSLQMS